MTKLKNSVATIAGVLGAIVITPIVALFGLTMLGFVFGLSLLAAAAMAIFAWRAENEFRTEADSSHQTQPA